MPRSASRREFYTICLCVFVIALGLRLVYLGHLRQLPFYDHPIMDASYHDTWARDILAGTTIRAEPFFRAPLYPYFLALTYLVSKGSYTFPRILQFLLGSLTAVMAYALARTYFGRTAGIVAGLVAAVYPVLVYFDGELLTETLYIFLSMLGLVLIELALRRRATLLWLASGLAFGLALVTRPNVALFLPVALAGAASFAKRRLLATLLLAVGIMAPVVPVTIHNYEVSHEFIPLVWQGGINFYLGNNQYSNGWSATSPEMRRDWWGEYNDMIATVRQALGREPSFNEVSGYWTHKGLAFIRTYPGRWLRLVAKKLALFWSSMEFPNNQDYNFMKLYSWVLRNPIINFGTVAPLALLGLLVLWPEARRLYFVYGLFITSFVGTIAFFVCDRYRLPALPLMFIFAGGAASRLVDAAKKRRLARLAGFAACLIAAALVVNLNVTGERLPDLAQSYCGLGKVYAAMGNDKEATRDFDSAIGVNPGWGEAYEQLGLIRMKAGDNDQATQLLTRATTLWPDFATPYRELAMIYLADGDTVKASQSIEAAIARAPFLEDAYNVLGSIQRKEGKPQEAVVSFLRELENSPGNWRAFANLGSTYAEIGVPEKAIEAYEKSIGANPDNPEAVLALATLYAKAGRNEAARALLDRIKTQPIQNLNLRYNRAVILQQSGSFDDAREIYEGILKENQFHEGSLVNLGVIYAKQGHPKDAEALWRRALTVNPSNETAKRNLELVRRQ